MTAARPLAASCVDVVGYDCVTGENVAGTVQAACIPNTARPVNY